MKALVSLLVAPVLFVIGLLGLNGKPLGGSDGAPPVNHATAFFENTWCTVKVALRLAVREARLSLASAALTVHSWLRIRHLAPPLYLAAAATAERDTQYREGAVLTLPLAASTKIYQGTLVATDASGNAKPAADTAGLRVWGRAEQTVDNSSGSAGDLTINVRRGVFKFGNSGSQAVTAAHRNRFVYAEDDQTVAISTTNRIVAGRVVEVASDGIWIDTLANPVAAAAVTTVGAAVATTGATNSTPFGYTTAAQADAIVTTLNALRTDVLALKDKINAG